MPQNVLVSVLGEGEYLQKLIRAILEKEVVPQRNLFLSAKNAAACKAAESTDSDISVELTGDDYDQLAETADDLANQISALPDAINVESSAGEQTPRVAVKINRENASRFGHHWRSGSW